MGEVPRSVQLAIGFFDMDPMLIFAFLHREEGPFCCADFRRPLAPGSLALHDEPLQHRYEIGPQVPHLYQSGLQFTTTSSPSLETLDPMESTKAVGS